MGREKRKPTLTPQQKLLVKNLIKGKSITDAALAAGYSEKCPGQVGHAALQAIKEKMPQVLAKYGLTDESLIEKYLKPLMEANETKFFAHEGRVTDQKDVIAWGPRRDGLDMAFKLRGDYKAAEKVEGTTVNYTFIAMQGREDAP